MNQSTKLNGLVIKVMFLIEKELISLGDKKKDDKSALTKNGLIDLLESC